MSSTNNLPSEGILLPAAQAQAILDAAGISKYYPVPDNGEQFSYNGKVYWIFNHDPVYGVTYNSPDAYHIVYQLSPYDIQLQQQQQPSGTDPLANIGKSISDFLAGLKNDLATVGITVLGAVVILVALYLFLVYGRKKQ